MAWLTQRQTTVSPKVAAMHAFVASALGGLLMVHVCGVIGLVIIANLSWQQALLGTLVFVPGDLIKCALTALVAAGPTGSDQTPVPPPPPPGSARGLRDLRDRISVPRDMPLHAARRLRQALEATAQRDPRDPLGQGAPIPLQHRRDQDPRPFLNPQSA